MEETQQDGKDFLDSSGKWEEGLHLGTANGALYMKKQGELFEPLQILTDKRSDFLTVTAVKTNEIDGKHWGLSVDQLSGWARKAIEEEGLEWPALA